MLGEVWGRNAYFSVTDEPVLLCFSFCSCTEIRFMYWKRWCFNLHLIILTPFFMEVFCVKLFLKSHCYCSRIVCWYYLFKSVTCWLLSWVLLDKSVVPAHQITVHLELLCPEGQGCFPAPSWASLLSAQYPHEAPGSARAALFPALVPSLDEQGSRVGIKRWWGQQCNLTFRTLHQVWMVGLHQHLIVLSQVRL